MKQGRLGYNSSNGRYGLLASDLWIDTGFHCGEGLEVLVDDEWVQTRMEMNLAREWYLVGTPYCGNLAVKVLDEYVKDFQKRNPTLRVFSCYLHQDEATPHLHIDFVPYVTNWKGKGMDTRVSLKQALKSLGFQGGNKHDTELNQWINHEKEVLAEIAKQHGIEWEQKETHEEHLDVYNFKKKERKKEVQELAEVQKDYQKLSGEKEILQGLADRYNRLLRMLGKDMVERLVQDDIRMQAELEAKKQKEQMPKKIGDRIQWARERSEEHNAQIKKNKTKYREMEL